MAGRHRRERPNARVVLSDIDHDSLGPNYEPALISREELMTIGCSMSRLGGGARVCW